MFPILTFDEEKVRSISRFIAKVDLGIPYSLLAFYSHFYLPDLPLFSRALAEECAAAARGGAYGSASPGLLRMH